MTAPLSPTAQDYLKVVWNATEWSDEPVTTKRLAGRLGVGAPTVSEQVRKLCDQGLLEHEPYGAITLTDAGRRHALAMVRRHRLIETFLVEVLGYGWDEVHDEAEVLEHACSERMIAAIAERLGHPERDPHGDPIPTADGRVPSPPATVLAKAAPGRWRVARLSDADPRILRQCDRHGLTLDAELAVLPGSGADGGLVRVDGRPADLALDPSTAAAVWVTPVERADAAVAR